MPRLTAIVVLDEHDERHQNQSSPTWHAREVAIERARRVGIPCLLVSPMPSLEARMATVEPVASVDTASRRSGWARIDVVDRRRDDPRTGLFSPRFADRARRELDAGRAVVCVLNRTGRSRLLACRSCDSIAECEVCGAAVRSSDDEVLECIRCSTTRPKVCLRCGSLAMKVLRTGVARVREDLGSLLGCEVGLVTASERDLEGARLIVGTEAVLHDTQDSLGSEVGLVALLDLDQELLAARYRASEQALGLLVLASRLVAGRRGSILVQTRNPSHEVIAAALATDPAVVCTADWPRREMLGLPPAASLAAVGGEAAREWIQRFGHPQGVEVQGPNDGWWLLRADDPVTLADAAGAVKRPPGRLRLRVDPMQLPVT
jgi:primosomal protein N' (replication factor Y)